jgi:hypothetical protein
MWTYDWYLDLIDYGMQHGNNFFLRHDVDISLKKALEMAEIEASRQFHSVYYILLSSPYYNALSPENLERIRMIKDLGMEIGLHYDANIKDGDANDHKNEICVQIGLLEHHIGTIGGHSVTFHKPVMGKDADFELVNLLNKEEVYVPNFDERFKYISDSGHNWREDPIEAFSESKEIHLNTHPEWYNDEEQSMKQCIYSLRLDKEADRLMRKEVKDINEYLHRINEESK